MKDDKPSTEVLIAPQLAVQRYLDELLQDATVHVDAIPDADDVQVSEDQASDEKNSEKQQEALELQGKTDAEIKHDQQDERVLHEIENEEDAFAAFEFAVAALENETEVDETDFVEKSEPVLEKALVEDEHLGQSELTEVNEENTELNSVIEQKTESETKLDETVQETQVESEPAKEQEEIASVETEFVSDKTKPLPWAESRFECLLFNVGGLKMAVPLVELGGIQKADYEKVTKIFGQPNWFIGVSSVNDLRIRTVDTAQWVMPNHYKGELHDSFKFIIQLDRSNWGLACEDVAEAISLEPSEVKWRSDRSKRPWLAGTVIDHMCAILDVQGFIELLDDPKNGFKAHLK